MKHFLTLADFTKEELEEILELSLKIKTETKNRVFKDYLPKQVLGMIFEKSSTRTRVSFETGIYQLGGIGMFLSSNDIQLGRGEPMSDTSRVISRMVDMVMIRTFEHSKLEEFAQHSQVPVINGLTDDFHPVQLMADYLTIMEEGKTENLVAAYVGDGNNLAHSWLMLASKMGFELRIATPKGYEVKAEILEKALEFAKISGAKISIGNDPKVAVKNATVVTTDTWVSMGQESQKEQKVKDFKGYIVDDAMMNLAHKDAIFLHCLPAYREYEVSTSVFEGPQSRVFEEAENRLHAQKGVMVWLDGKRND
ncbi:MAG: ornithine carbamoyltransferase [Deltaproteobacteria bacterium HGW-Deltaproteobacteria-24]|nr:MAG: ornithine carbamoyltransferase [Deltaproteobacteria bacterium HGW-Deltaproteobacteria-24]